jgi:hypothetical protein
MDKKKVWKKPEMRRVFVNGGADASKNENRGSKVPGEKGGGKFS